MTTLYLLPGMLDELTRTVQDSIAPAIAKGHGFGGMMMLHESQIGRVLVLELWETEADLVASDRNSGEFLPAMASSLLAEPAMHSLYEISVHVDVTEQGSARVRGI
jgi:heme-degrading monooxygenase HmoA